MNPRNFIQNTLGLSLVFLMMSLNTFLFPVLPLVGIVIAYCYMIFPSIAQRLYELPLPKQWFISLIISTGVGGTISLLSQVDWVWMTALRLGAAAISGTLLVWVLLWGPLFLLKRLGDVFHLTAWTAFFLAVMHGLTLFIIQDSVQKSLYIAPIYMIYVGLLWVARRQPQSIIPLQKWIFGFTVVVTLGLHLIFKWV